MPYSCTTILVLFSIVACSSKLIVPCPPARSGNPQIRPPYANNSGLCGKGNSAPAACWPPASLLTSTSHSTMFTRARIRMAWNVGLTGTATANGSATAGKPVLLAMPAAAGDGGLWYAIWTDAAGGVVRFTSFQYDSPYAPLVPVGSREPRGAGRRATCVCGARPSRTFLWASNGHCRTRACPGQFFAGCNHCTSVPNPSHCSRIRTCTRRPVRVSGSSPTRQRQFLPYQRPLHAWVRCLFKAPALRSCQRPASVSVPATLTHSWSKRERPYSPCVPRSTRRLVESLFATCPCHRRGCCRSVGRGDLRERWGSVRSDCMRCFGCDFGKCPSGLQRRAPSIPPRDRTPTSLSFSRWTVCGCSARSWERWRRACL